MNVADYFGTNKIAINSAFVSGAYPIIAKKFGYGEELDIEI